MTYDEDVELVAEALAREFTSPGLERNPAWDIEKPDGPDNEYYLGTGFDPERVHQGMFVHFTGGDGGRSIRGATPSECARAAIDALDLPARDRRVKAKSLREVADDWQMGEWADAPRRADPAAERIANAQYVADWLRRRAGEIEAGS